MLRASMQVVASFDSDSYYMDDMKGFCMQLIPLES